MKPIAQYRYGGDVDLRALEPHLKRQPVKPGVAAGPAQLDRLALAAADDGPRAFATISTPTTPKA